MHRLMLHPCVSNDERNINCGEFFSATSILRFQSFFTQKRVVASYTFEVSLLFSTADIRAHTLPHLEIWARGPRQTHHCMQHRRAHVHDRLLQA